MQTRKRLWIMSGGLAMLLLVTAIPWAVLADDLFNEIDATVDSAAEIMTINLGDAAGTTQIGVMPRNGDGKNGCNLTGGTTLGVSVSSSNTSVATVSPSTLTFSSCGATPTITVTAVNVGSADITMSQTSNNTGGTFNFDTAKFTVNVAPPPNSAPNVSVTNVTLAASYPFGSVPVAGCSVQDAEDGSPSISPTISPVVGPLAAFGIGNQTATCSYTDTGGLTDSDSVTYAIVDTVAPDTSITSGPAENSFTKSTSASFGFQATDNVTNSQSYFTFACRLDGASFADCTSTNPNSYTGLSEGNHTFEVKATDLANNSDSTPASRTWSIDLTPPNPPTVSATLAGGGTYLAGNWTNKDVTVSFAGNGDPISGGVASGVDTCTAQTVLNSSTPLAGTTASGTCTDKAGNESTPASITVKIDKIDPVVNVTGVNDGAEYTLGSVSPAGCTTTDSLSGVKTNATLTVTQLSGSGGVGTFKASCNGAEDNAGNTNTAAKTYSVIYDWSGFFQPVENPSVWNAAKAGNSIPVKFSLNGNQGLSIFESGYPRVKAVSCPSANANVDQIEEYATATVSGLKYDSATDQYNYQWKTDKSWVGKCMQLTVKLIDGEEHVANFSFK